jgi:glycosyltransferase involved in cell wall biosynthesis
MSAGVPVIASDFPLWREILLPRDCGICVDPEDPAAIAQAIDDLVSNPERAAEMGRNGQAAVRDEYNWANEEGKLLRLYEDMLT